jgi:osmotically-inducible protein OsmY
VGNKANAQIRSILEMADKMIVISNQGFLSCQDDGCLLLNGMVRECAYRLRDAAKREREHHGMQMGEDSDAGGRIAGDAIEDTTITARVKTVLSTHRTTSSMKTDVETRNGQVTLTGIARSAATKALITRRVAAVRGVSSVKNQMTVEAARAK